MGARLGDQDEMVVAVLTALVTGWVGDRMALARLRVHRCNRRNAQGYSRKGGRRDTGDRDSSTLATVKHGHSRREGGDRCRLTRAGGGRERWFAQGAAGDGDYLDSSENLVNNAG